MERQCCGCLCFDWLSAVTRDVGGWASMRCCSRSVASIDTSLVAVVRQVVIARDEKGKSRGYGFIQFEVEADMKDAYRRGDGRKIDGRR